ncbi:Stk1 family PASTA domain-containing Ser/Thr kinase [Jatrophihabitans sp. YIM 134969]
MRTAVADPLVGRVLEGRYRLGERLARGGMSTVYVARDLRLDRAVAVKVMTSDLSADSAFTDRFAREARAAARLSHLNVVGVYDQGHDDGHVFLVMELVEGSTVRDLVVDRGALPLPLAVAVMEPMLAALAAAHRAGLVHRDVKPENVLLSDDGLVKVADFGLARAVESDVSSTRTNLMMGTVAYCSPEQVTTGHADARSDVYAAGVVLFELLTGRVPYVGQSAVQVAYQHVHSRVPAPSSRVRGVPEQIDDLIVRATDPDPSSRPADAGAFLAELHDLRSTLRIPVTPLPTGLGRARARVEAPPPAPAPSRTAPVRRPVAASDTTASMRAVADPAYGTATFGPDAVAAAGRPTHHLGDEWTGGWGPGAAPGRPRAATSPPPPPVDEIDPVAGDADAYPARRRRRRRRTLAVLLVLLLLGAAIGYGSWWYAAGRWASIPDVVRQPASAATSALRNAGFEVGATDQVFSETVDPGLVVATDPTVGDRRTHGTSVTLTVSRGPERFAIPTTAKLPQKDAERVLSTLPVNVSVVTAPSETVPAGVAIGTTPPSGREVKRDTRITLTISSGLPVVPVPDVTDKPQDDAKSTLEAAGFTVTFGDQQFSDTVPAGAVISQTPAGGAPDIRKGSTVTLVVSKGQDLVTIPRISSGTGAEAATSQLQAAGLTVKVDKQYGGYLGLVVGMDPKSGTQVKRGSVVTLTVV